ncbi:MAG TPA: hypothetical protein VLQ46_13340, partial [Casimicrobiaceae bacterium]|nr:hypothetical protein [Casimicrobiaceae bacterium]
MSTETVEQTAKPDGARDPHSDNGWQAQIDACRKRREKFVTGPWQMNVSMRVQKPYSQAADAEADSQGSDQIAVPADWSRTRSKSASLFSKMPRVSLEALQQKTAAAVPMFEKVVNHFAPRTGIASVMEECEADVVNACGICAAMMKYEATFEMVDVPKQDVSMIPPDQLQGYIDAGLVEMTQVPQVVSERYRAYRISPAQLLWPVEFRGSDWQRARFIGYDGTMPWARAKDEFKLDDADKDEVCSSSGGDIITRTLAGDLNREQREYDDQVHFAEIFYWAALCDPNEKRFEAIRRRVMVQGKEGAVIDEEYTGQTWDAQSKTFIGCTRLPIEVQTLTYVSDKPIPPSDSEIGRPQVWEQMRSRSQILMQRTRNIPIRTVDVNRVDPVILDLVQRGIWQGMIPTNGPGDRTFSQIASAAYPKEDFSFDAVVNRDLDDAWSMSPNQMGNYNTGERSATEAQNVAGAYASVIGFQRDKIVNMFLGLIDTLMGLLQLNLDQFEAIPIVGEDGAKRLEQWDRTKIAGKFVAMARQDASVLQDASARTNQIMKFLNIAGKSGRINIDPILSELAALSGLDPAGVLLPPAQPKQEDPNMSFRVSGLADLLNPLTLAFLIKSGQ